LRASTLTKLGCKWR